MSLNNQTNYGYNTRLYLNNTLGYKKCIYTLNSAYYGGFSDVSIDGSIKEIFIPYTQGGFTLGLFCKKTATDSYADLDSMIAPKIVTDFEKKRNPLTITPVN